MAGESATIKTGNMERTGCSNVVQFTGKGYTLRSGGDNNGREIGEFQDAFPHLCTVTWTMLIESGDCEPGDEV
jgi:hypothetical protein